MRALSLFNCLSLLASGSLFMALNTAQASGLEVYTETNFHGLVYMSTYEYNYADQGNCVQANGESISPASDGHQFSIKSHPERVCLATLKGGQQICVDAEGWKNIASWPTVTEALCYSRDVARCEGRNIRIQSQCP
jgi:hypothetical protein